MYHLCKHSRLYNGSTYCGPTSNYELSEFNTLEEAKEAVIEFTKRNPVGWDIYNANTGEIYNWKLDKFERVN